MNRKNNKGSKIPKIHKSPVAPVNTKTSIISSEDKFSAHAIFFAAFGIRCPEYNGELINFGSYVCEHGVLRVQVIPQGVWPNNNWISIKEGETRANSTDVKMIFDQWAKISDVCVTSEFMYTLFEKEYNRLDKGGPIIPKVEDSPALDSKDKFRAHAIFYAAFSIRCPEEDGNRKSNGDYVCEYSILRTTVSFKNIWPEEYLLTIKAGAVRVHLTTISGLFNAWGNASDLQLSVDDMIKNYRTELKRLEDGGPIVPKITEITGDYDK